MAIYDPHFGGYRIFVGDLGRQTTRYDVEREYEHYGQLVDVWVARNPPGFAFIVFKNLDECERAVRKSHGRRLCGRRVRVEYARPFDDRSGKQNPPISRPTRLDDSNRYRDQGPRRHQHRSRSKDRKRSKRSRSKSRSSSADGRPARYSREQETSVSKDRERFPSPAAHRDSLSPVSTPKPTSQSPTPKTKDISTNKATA